MIQSQISSSKSIEDTLQTAETLGKRLSAPCVIFLTGDLGSGKTLFTRGLCQGLGLQEIWEVDSPTYTLMNEYATQPPVFHFDLYRISDESELDSISFFEIMDNQAIKVVEWPERLQRYRLTQNGYLVQIKKTGPTTREILIKPISREQ